MTLVDSRIYLDGRRVESPSDLHHAYEALDRTGGVAWIGLLQPDADELSSVAGEFGLHALAVEDAGKGHQRPKLERYGDTLFVVLRPAWYDAQVKRVELGEVHLFSGPDFVITVRHDLQPDLTEAGARIETDPEFLSLGAEAVLTALLDDIVDGYTPVVERLQDDVDEVEDRLFADETDPRLASTIYRLVSQVIGLQRAVGPLPQMVQAMLRGADKYGTGDDVQNRLRNVLDHAIRVTERVDTFRALLDNALTVHSTLVTMEQNDAMRRMSSASLAQGEESRRLAKETIEQGEEVKKISSWAAILFTPTLIASVYGMNFDSMPELHWVWGYPFAIALMVGLGVGLWGVFKRKHWL